MNEKKLGLEDIVSPSDLPLLDLIGGEIDNIVIATEVFSDRNSTEATAALITGVIQTVIKLIVGVYIPAEEIHRLCVKYSDIKEDDND